jgi:hypothetical protein
VGAIFFAYVQTCPGARPASCTMGNGSFPGVKRPGHGADHQPHPSAEVKNEELYLCFPSGPFMACYRVTCTLHCMSLIFNFGTRTYKTGHIPYNNSFCIYLPHTHHISKIYSTSLSPIHMHYHSATKQHYVLIKLSEYHFILLCTCCHILSINCTHIQDYCISWPIRRNFPPKKCDLNSTCVSCN